MKIAKNNNTNTNTNTNTNILYYNIFVDYLNYLFY
jgi:hypothetical protein